MIGLDDDLVGRALPFPNQAGAGDRPVIGTATANANLAAVELFAELLKSFDRGGLQTAVGQLLQAVSQTVFQKAAVVRRRFGVEQIVPVIALATEDSDL